MKPEDLYTFVQLPGGSGLRVLERNQRLLALAARVDTASGADRSGETTRLDDATRKELKKFLADFRGAFEMTPDTGAEWTRLLSGMARRGREPGKPHRPRKAELGRARSILDLARTTCRLRDDHNLYLGRIEAQLRAAEREQPGRGLGPARGPNDNGPEDEILVCDAVDPIEIEAGSQVVE